MKQIELFEGETLVFFGEERYKAFCEYCNNQDDRCVYSARKPDRLGYYTIIEALNKYGVIAKWQR